MRGHAISPQPYSIKGSDEQIDEYEYAFCWNGECYSYTSNEDEEKDLDNKTTTFHSFDAVNDIDYKSDTRFVIQLREESIQKSKKTNYDTPSTAQRLQTETGEYDNQQTNKPTEGENTWQLHKG